MVTPSLPLPTLDPRFQRWTGQVAFYTCSPQGTGGCPSLVDGYCSSLPLPEARSPGVFVPGVRPSLLGRTVHPQFSCLIIFTHSQDVQ